MSPTIIDFMGKKIRLGDTVVYPVRRKSDMCLKKAVVIEHPMTSKYTVLKGIKCLDTEGRRIVLRVPERCVVVNRLELPDANVPV